MPEAENRATHDRSSSAASIEGLVERLEQVRKFAALKSKQMSEQAFGDSRVEDAAASLEDVAMMLADVLTVAALLRPSRPSGEPPWQPIETAPQMRKVIVFYRNALGKRRTVMACYYKAHSLEMHDDYADVAEYDDATGESYAPEGWYEEHDSDSPLMPLQESPTHWMPLPASPVPERRGADQ